jgi:hypothetical protein
MYKKASRLECLWLAIRMAYWMTRRMWQPQNLSKRHWKSVGLYFLVARTNEELSEFNSERNWAEAADVANFLAMTADLKC